MNRLTRALLFGGMIAVVAKAAQNNKRINELYRSEGSRKFMVALGLPDPGKAL